jgi:hypothetical protein
MIYFMLDVFFLFETKGPEFDMEALSLKYQGSCGVVHHFKFWGSSRLSRIHKPKIKQRRIFADLTMYHL